MKWVIQGTIFGCHYFLKLLDVGFEWQGLINNATIFDTYEDACRTVILFENSFRMEVEVKQTKTLSGNIWDGGKIKIMIEKIWGLGYLAAPKRDENDKLIREENPLMGYRIEMILTDGKRVGFEGTDVNKVNYETINYILNLYRDNPHP